MNRIALARLLLLAPLFGAGIPRAAHAADKPSPSYPYHHLWRDANGISHIASCEMRHFELSSMNKPADPQWQDTDPGKAQIVATVQPPHFNGAWHEDPKPQWIVPLHGSWFVTAQDGTRVVMGPGDIMLGEDQGTKPDAKGQKGHLSGNIGDGAVELMVMQLDSASVANQPCRFK